MTKNYYRIADGGQNYGAGFFEGNLDTDKIMEEFWAAWKSNATDMDEFFEKNPTYDTYSDNILDENGGYWPTAAGEIGLEIIEHPEDEGCDKWGDPEWTSEIDGITVSHWAE